MRDRLPSAERLAEAEEHLLASYRTYAASRPLGKALVDDASGYFAVPLEPEKQAPAITNATIAFINRVAKARNVATF